MVSLAYNDPGQATVDEGVVNASVSISWSVVQATWIDCHGESDSKTSNADPPVIASDDGNSYARETLRLTEIGSPRRIDAEGVNGSGNEGEVYFRL